MGTELATLLLQAEVSLEQILMKINDYPKNKHVLLSLMSRYEEELNKNENRQKSLNSELAGYGDKDQIKRYQSDRDENEKLLNQCCTRLEHLKRVLNKLESDLDDLESSREEIYKKNEKLKVAKARLEWLDKAYQKVVSIEENLMDESRLEIAKATNVLFKRLIWKEDYFDRVEIDEGYNVWLYNAEGWSCLANISAAERALLALSYTIALHKVSGFEPPLIIDTPVARISDENRRNFAKVLKEASKEKQIILLFTPSEFSEEIESEVYRDANRIRTISLPEKANRQEVMIQ